MPHATRTTRKTKTTTRDEPTIEDYRIDAIQRGLVLLPTAIWIRKANRAVRFVIVAWATVTVFWVPADARVGIAAANPTHHG
jgi:hypothetical protein